MFASGKRNLEGSVGGQSPSNKRASTKDPNFPHAPFLDFIIAHAHQDERPYLRLTVLDRPFLGLLDSGATRTIVGQPGYQFLKELGFSLQPHVMTCTVANGQSCESIGTMYVPMTLMGRTHLVDLLVVPALHHQLILGIDFWKTMGVVPDLRQNAWHFSNAIATIDTRVGDGLLERSTLSREERLALEKLIADKIAVMGTSLGLCNMADHEIELLPGTKPIKQRYYPVSPSKQKVIDEEVSSMLEQGIIEPSRSAWSSPVCLVRKKDGSYRFCIDFRQLNAVTKKDAYPLPYMSAILDQLRDARYLSTIDIKSAYYQIPMNAASKGYTAFTVPGRGLFQFCRMPFGLSNAPATWQRVIDRVLGADLQPSVLVYLDDIIIVSQTFEEHLHTLSLVFDRLHAAGLVVSPDKCQYCRPQLRYLGYIVDGQGLHPDPEKVEAILTIPRPKNVTEIRRFVGTASWYRRFIPDFASLLAPLTQLTKRRVTWKWTPECEESFRTVKERLVTAPILACPDFNRTFILQTDASAYGIGAVLSQEYPDGEKVIAYLSRSLTRTERNYSCTEREALAVIFAVEKLRHYLEGVHFKVITDHHSLLWLQKLKDPQGRLARWVLRLQPYDFELIHRKGRDHVVPDCLSRAVPDSSVAEVSLVEVDDRQTYSPSKDRWYRRMIQMVEEDPRKYKTWRIENGVLFKYVTCAIPELSRNSDCWKLVIPKEGRAELLQRCHDIPTAGHVGTYKTYWRLRQRYYWPKMRIDVMRYVKSCHVCAAHKPEQRAPAGLMGTRPDIREPWRMVSLDFIGPLPRSTHGNIHCLVVTDFFSKYVVLFPLRSANAQSLVKCVEEGIFLVYGAPQYLICDNGTPMKSTAFRELCSRYRTQISYTASYLPRADPTERVNRVVKTMISSFVRGNQRKWDECLAAIGCAIRTARHETTGQTPYFINFGREHRLHGSEFAEQIIDDVPNIDREIENRQKGFTKLYNDVARRLQSCRERSKRIYDLRRRSVQYTPGQRVWRRNKCQSDALRFFNAKLAPKFVGPFTVRRKVGAWTYELQDELGISKGVWHVQDLKQDETGANHDFPV